MVSTGFTHVVYHSPSDISVIDGSSCYVNNPLQFYQPNNLTVYITVNVLMHAFNRQHCGKVRAVDILSNFVVLLLIFHLNEGFSSGFRNLVLVCV